MAADMWLYWEARGHLTEGRRRLWALLEALEAQGQVKGKALWVAGYLALGQTDAQAAAPLLEQSLEVAGPIGDRQSMAFATQYLGLGRLFAGDPAGATGLLEKAFRMQQEIGQGAAAFTLSDLAVTLMLQGDLAKAIPLYEDALAMTEHGGDPWTRSHCLWGLGIATWLRGDTSGAEEAEKEALRLAGELDERTGIALSLEALAWMSASGRDFERSARLRGAALSVWESIPRRLRSRFGSTLPGAMRRREAGWGASGSRNSWQKGGGWTGQRRWRSAWNGNRRAAARHQPTAATPC